MIPLQLTIKGIHSYKEESKIDFSRLTEAGLFGVFGPTGSGKSTILEAITLALYSDNERMNNNKRGYNQLNLQSDELLVDFHFLVEHTGKEYRFVHQYKRSKKDFTKVGSPERNAYLREGNEWIPIAPDNAEAIIGMSYTNFKRTMIIPQGKFQEFLSLGGTDRTAMMAELFDLGKYDLSDKTAFLQNQAKNEKTVLDTQLLGLQGISAEALRQKEAELAQMQERIVQKEAQIQAWDAVILPLSRIVEAQNNLKEKHTQRSTAIAQLQALQVRMDVLNAKAAEPWASGDNHSRVEQEIKDLENVLQWTHKSQLRLAEADKYQKYQTTMDAIQVKKRNLDEQIETIRAAIADKRLRLPKVVELKDAEARLTQLSKLSKDSTIQLDNLQRATTNAREVSKPAFEAVGAVWEPAADSTQLLEQLQSFKSQVEADSVTWNEALSLLQKKSEQLAVDATLQEWSTALHDGEACPLCGAVHHPHKFSSAENEVLRTQVASEMQTLQTRLQNHQLTRDTLMGAIGDLKGWMEKGQEAQNRVLQLEQEINDLRGQHQASNFSALDLSAVQEQLAAVSRQEKEIEADEKSLSEAEKERKAQDQRQDEGNKLLSDSLASLNRLEGEIEQLEKNISNKSWMEQGLSEQALAELLLEKRALLQSWKMQFDAWQEETAHVRKEQDGLQGSVGTLEQQIRQYEEQLNLHQGTLAGLWEQNKAALSDPELPVYPHTDNAATVVQQWQALRAQSQDDRSTTAKSLEYIGNEIRTLMAKLAEKEQLGQKLEKLENRMGQLDSLARLFRSRAFVTFMSHTYLLDLCRLANERFQKLNRNQLILEIDDKYDFVVRDIANGGKTRNVSSLSGGQLFQASLCLALALSEQIRKSDHQQFFFLDEGFGSQDENSLELIMQTLKDLKKEKRIVGLISHVEKMKEDIGVYLNITHSTAQGSKVQGNWEI